MRALLFTLLLSCAAVWVLATENEINFLFSGMIPGGSSGSSSGGDSTPPSDGDCSWVDHDTLRDNLAQAVCGTNWPCASDSPGAIGDNGGFNFNMWATVVNRQGSVCAVVYSGPTWTDQWTGSRVISAQKANTGNLFCLHDFALSTANLFAPVQPGGSLYGLQHSNPVDATVAYAGPSENYGNPCGSDNQDGLCGRKVGGINVFGGGLGLYNGNGALIGGVGVSGDSSCADHNIAWKLRTLMGLNHVPAGPGYFDNIIYPSDGSDTLPGFGHPVCSEAAAAVAASFETDPEWQIPTSNTRKPASRNMKM